MSVERRSAWRRLPSSAVALSIAPPQVCGSSVAWTCDSAFALALGVQVPCTGTWSSEGTNARRSRQDRFQADPDPHVSRCSTSYGVHVSCSPGPMSASVLDTHPVPAECGPSPPRRDRLEPTLPQYFALFNFLWRSRPSPIELIARAPTSIRDPIATQAASWVLIV
jgi:hypothetical protein